MRTHVAVTHFHALARARSLLLKRFMSAIVSLLRVMTLRDAEAIVLEPGKSPVLRRRGNVEALAMPALEPAAACGLRDAAARRAVARRRPADGRCSADAGVTYPVTLEQTGGGVRIVVRKPRAAEAARRRAPNPCRRRAPRRCVSRSASSTAVHRWCPRSTAASRRGAGSPSCSPRRSRSRTSAAPPMCFLSTGHGARVKLDGRLEPLDVRDRR